MMKPVDTLRRPVELESPTGDPSRIAHIGEFISAELASLGGGCTTTARWSVPASAPRTTVRRGCCCLPIWTPCGPRGRSRGCRSGWTATWRMGPVALDMKGGIVVMLEALRRGMPFGRPVSVLVTADEEIGSPKRAAARRGTGAPRRGCARARAAGAGTGRSPRNGRDRPAISCGSRARRPTRVTEGRASPPSRSWRTRRCGSSSCATVNAASVSTSAKSLVARETTSLRLRHGRGLTRGRGGDEQWTLEEAIYGLRPMLDGARLTVTGGITRPPMIRDDAAKALAARAIEIARRTRPAGRRERLRRRLGRQLRRGRGHAGAGRPRPAGRRCPCRRRARSLRSIDERADLVSALLRQL